MEYLDPKSFGQLIRARRKEKGLQQRELALLIGSGERYIVDLENGKPTCQIGKALSAARALGLQLVPAGDVPRDTPESEDGYDLPDIPFGNGPP